MELRPNQMILRCYAELDGDQWVAVCLDLSLAAQGDSFAEVRKKLQGQIAEYVYDVTVGQDRENAAQLFPRRAPLVDWLRYYSYKARARIGGLNGNLRQLFIEILPMQPLRAA